MGFLLPLAGILTASITIKTIEKTSKTMKKRREKESKKTIK